MLVGQALKMKHFLTRPRNIVILSVLAGLVFVAADAAIDAKFFEHEPILECLFTRVTPEELVARSFLFLFFMAFGLTASFIVKKLNDSNAKFRDLSENSPNVIFINKGGKIVYANQKFQQISGYDMHEVYDASFDFMTLTAPEDADRIRASIAAHSRGQEVPASQYTLVTKNGTRFPAIVSMKLIDYEGSKAVLGVITDITEIKQMQQQLIVNDRLASIGLLASGVAHEVGNPLTVIIGYANTLPQMVDLPDGVKEGLSIIAEESERAGNILKNLLTFARSESTEKQAVSVNESLDRVLELRAYQQKLNKVQVHTNLAPGLPEVKANRTRLEQVFYNIIVNAEFAVKEARESGNLDVTTERIDGKVRITIADDGTGISKENMLRLFTPFFTTKKEGQGTGLGLSVCQGIVHDHGGRIWAESTEGKGASFFIELPAGSETAKT